MALVLDTSVLLASLDSDDPDHPECASLLATDEELIVPSAVLVELDYLLGKRSRLEVWLAFVDRVAEGGYAIYELDAGQLLRAARLEARYADLKLGFVDAAVFLTCVELREDRVATLDQRHFSVLRTEDGTALRILPG